MSEKEIVDVVELPNLPSELFSFYEDKFEYRPDDLFDAYNTQEEDRFTFTLKPLTDADKIRINVSTKNSTIQLLLWAKKEGFDITKIDSTEGMYLDEDGNGIKYVLGKEDSTGKVLAENDEENEDETYTIFAYRIVKDAKGKDMIIREEDDVNRTPSKLWYDNAIIRKKMESSEDHELYFNILQKYVTGLKNYKSSDRKEVKFKKQPGKDYISDKLWTTIKKTVKIYVFNELLRVSSTSMEELTNL